jgi:Fe-S-cluster containining protein
MNRQPAIGRNDPCPCGSGKKYKKCCGPASSRDASNTEPDYFALNRAIAYRGQIGRKRQQFCQRYMEHKQTSFKQIEQQAKHLIASTGETVTCNKGCSYCCAHHVPATLQECELIVYYLYQNQTLLDHFLRVYPAWRARVKNHEDLFQAVKQRFSDMPQSGFAQGKREAFYQAAGRYNEQGIPCPFLNQDLCSIYEVRPSACATFFSMSPPEYCSSSSPDEPKVIFVHDAAQIKEPEFYLRNLRILVILPLPLGVYEILKAGLSYLAMNIPGLEDLDREFWRDPEVMPMVQRFRARQTP